MIRSILKTMLLALAAFGALSGCDSGTSSNGGGAPSGSDVAGVWSRSFGSTVENVTLNPDGTASLDSLSTTGTRISGARYTGTWTGSGASFAVTWSGYATTSDGTSWSSLVTLPSMTPYPFTVNGNTATVVVNGVERTYTKGVAALPTTEVVAPAIAPSTGTFATAQSVVITTPTIGGVIYYTTDGSTPTTSSSLYSAPITVSATKTIKAVTVAGAKTSSVVSATITIDPGVSPTDKSRDPSLVGPWMMLDFNTMAGTSYQFDSTGQAIYVRSEGTGKPSHMLIGQWSTSNGSLSIRWAMEQLSADGSGNYSPVSTVPAPFQATYQIVGTKLTILSGTTRIELARAQYNEPTKPGKPTISPVGGTFTSAQTVRISGPAGAEIRYTTDGSDPDGNSKLYTTAITVSRSMTVKAIAIDGQDESDIVSAGFVIQTGTSTLDPAVVGTWQGFVDSVSTTMTFTAAGTFTGTGVMNVAGTDFHLRMSGTWSTSAGKLTSIQLTSEYSVDGATWMSEPDFQPTPDEASYVATSTSLVITTDGKQETFTKVAQ